MTEPSLKQETYLDADNLGGNSELRLLLNSLRSSVIYFDRWCVVRYANMQACQWQKTPSLLGKSFIDLAKGWDNPYERHRELMQVIRSGEACWKSEECCFSDGQEFWYQVDKIPTRDNSGDVDGVLLILQDTSEHVIQNKALRESETRYRALVKNSADALWHYEIRPPVNTTLPYAEQARLIYRRAHLAECNKKLADLFGFESTKELIGLPLYVKRSMVSKEEVESFVKNHYRLEGAELSALNSKGEHLLLETSAIGEVDNGMLLRFWGSSRDITEHKQYLDRMEYLANHDSLTSLPNRIYLYRRIEETLSSRKGDQKCALLLMDLDRFKEINDTLGHLTGDKVLKEIGPRLESELGELPGVVARLGGDEFAIFLSNIRNPQQAVVMAHRFLDAICQMFELDGIHTEISASIGVSISPDQAQDVTTMMRYADVAMYHAKRRLKGVSLYDPNYDSHSPFRLELMGALGRAIRENELHLHYQPKIQISEDCVYGFEALLRWEHPQLGSVPPSDFIPIAEMSNVIYPLSVWVMEETIKQCAQWREQGLSVTVAMNLSARNLMDERVVDDLKRLLNEYQLEGQYLEMEITESMIMSDPKRAQIALEKINTLGVKLSIDDFGTGYSSLAYLKRLPVQTLKVDRTFVDGMLDDEHDEIIVHSTIQLAHNLGLSVVAEGVENVATYERLRELQCDAVQGYLFARPMDKDKAENWFKEGGWMEPIKGL